MGVETLLDAPTCSPPQGAGFFEDARYDCGGGSGGGSVGGSGRFIWEMGQVVIFQQRHILFFKVGRWREGDP